ncbi:3-hydroxyacyl-CoA dehydrogenase family protein [Salicibibacter kimchii]|uniref:3-hydroxyacyl-CoA dehydrogenase NAD binding domain-containing protein n=1 Tax=Salicibibacter kimchii TaxID=2099786 RepID=A0A345BW19_9BACI|nr:3-hydroxyacyl-CoA dehydrogenase NAD-binding domain-containing protein [Salicibibacter kimchii]AXF55150.1 hypothetical protein DT065_03365 [Salicibibacter kimchii]
MVQSIRKVAVIGGGATGSQIAAVCALAGFDVNIHDRHEETFSKNMEEISQHLQRKVEKGKLSWQDLEDSFARLFFEPELESAVNESDFVIEAEIKDRSIKRDMFKSIDQYAPAHAIFATYSSSIADATERPAQVCHFHFFNLELIDVVKGPHTSDETAETAMDFGKKLNAWTQSGDRILHV